MLLKVNLSSGEKLDYRARKMNGGGIVVWLGRLLIHD
jgi:hypothetical protein